MRRGGERRRKKGKGKEGGWLVFVPKWQQAGA